MYSCFYKSLLFFLLCISCAIACGQSPESDSMIIRSEKILKDIEHVSSDSVKITLLSELIDLNTESRPSLVKGWLEEGIAIATRNNYPEKQLALQLKQLRLLNIQGQFINTLKNGKQLLPLLDKFGTPLQRAAYLLSMGNAHQRTGDYDQAAALFIQAIELCEANNIRDIEVRAAMNLGNLYQFLNRYDDMLLHLQRTLVKAEKYNLTEDIPMIKFNISNAEAHLNNFGKAITYLLEVLPYYQQTGNQYALGLAYANLSWCYFKSQKKEVALDYAYKSYAIRSALRDEAGLTHLELNLGKIYLENAQYDSCLKYAGSSVKKGLALKLLADVRDNYETLFLLYERQGDFATANKYLHQFYAYKDSINIQERDKTLDMKLANYRIASNDAINKDLNSLKRREKIYQVAIGLLLLSLGFIIVRFYTAKKKALRKKMADHEAVQTSNSYNTPGLTAGLPENSPLLKEIDELRAENEKIRRELNAHKSTDVSELRDMIFSDKLHSDAYWNEFLLVFSKVYPDFFEKMKQEFPALNQNELRISALIKLNHNITDMARALNITVDSARKARYRLYKKIGLSSDQELIDRIMLM